MTNGVCMYDDVLRQDDNHILKWALHFEVEDQRKKGRLKSTWKEVEEESVKVVV